MNSFMILPLLLMYSSVISGHSIKKLEINNQTEADVYEIKEDTGKNTIAFVNPKAEKPTLREIVYYHMIERPYGENEGRVRYDSEEGPEIDETMRPFTNSHGFPFLETVEKELDIEANNKIKEDSVDENKDIIIEETKQKPNEDEGYEVIYEYYDEELPASNNKGIAEEKKDIPLTTVSEIVQPSTTEANTEKATIFVTRTPVPEASTDSEITTETHLTEETTQAVTIAEFPTVEVTGEAVFEKKAKTARKLLFDRVKERYYSKPNVTQNATSERRKREIHMIIPEAPRLEELNYESLPPYLRKLISTEKPKTRINSDSESDEDERLDDIKHRMHKMISKLKTTDKTEEKAPKTRTYGMKLTGDSGYVWNDMTKPRTRYNVDAMETEEIKKKETDSISALKDLEKLDEIKKEIDDLLSELKEEKLEKDEEVPKPISYGTKKTDIDVDSGLEDLDELDEINKEIDDLLKELKEEKLVAEEAPKPRTYGMNLTADSGYVWNDITNPRIHYTVEASESTEEVIKDILEQEDDKDEKSIEEHKPEEKHEHKHENHDDEEKNTSDNNNSFEDKGRKRNKHNKKDDKITEIMDSDVFWDWLADLTSVYIDVLTDHMTEAIKEEIAEQIKAGADKKKEDSKEPEEHKKAPEEPKKDQNVTEEKDIENNNDQKTSEPVKDDKNSELEKSDNDNKEIKSEVDENGKDLLRKRKDDKKKKEELQIEDKEPHKNETKPNIEIVKVQAQNIYGNTMGGEKVTNIFIFYPNQDPDKILHDISKLNDTNHVNVDIRLNVTNKDSKDEVSKNNDIIQEKNKEIKENQVDIQEKDETTTPAPLENNKDVITEIPTESTTTEAPKVSVEPTTETIPETTTTKGPETTTIGSETTESEPSTESVKVESTTAYIKEDDNSTKDKSTTALNKEDEDLTKEQVENDTKDDKKDSEKDEKEKETKDNKTENNGNHEIKDDSSTTEKTVSKEQNKEDIASSTTASSVNESNTEMSTEAPK